MSIHMAVGRDRTSDSGLNNRRRVTGWRQAAVAGALAGKRTVVTESETGVREAIARKEASVTLPDWDGNQVEAVESGFRTSGTDVISCVDVDLTQGSFLVAAGKRWGLRNATPTTSPAPGPIAQPHDETRLSYIFGHGWRCAHHAAVQLEYLAEYNRDVYAAVFLRCPVASIGGRRKTAGHAPGWSGQGSTRASVAPEAPWSLVEGATR